MRLPEEGAKTKRQALQTLVVAILFGVQVPDAGARMWEPDIQLSTASMPNMPPGQTATLLGARDGTGPSFADARLAMGAHVDGMIKLTVLDAGGFPIARFPRDAVAVGMFVAMHLALRVRQAR